MANQLIVRTMVRLRIVGILIKDMFLINVLAIVLCNVTVLLLIGKGVEIYEKKSER